jgi:hypothetical protein
VAVSRARFDTDQGTDPNAGSKLESEVLAIDEQWFAKQYGQVRALRAAAPT